MTKRALAMTLVVVAAVGCGGKKKGGGGSGTGAGTGDGPSPDTTPTPVASPAPSSAFHVTGSVTYAGEAKLETSRAAQDQATCGTSVTVPGSIRVEAGKLRDVALWLEGTPKGSGGEGKVVIDQKKCTYDPWIATATVGAMLDIGNSDPVMHNVHGYKDDSTTFNESTLGGKHLKQKLEELGDVVLKCDVHPWMESHVKVFDHPYHGVAAADGTFSLPAPPAGDYELVAWHQKLGEKRVKVTVPADGDAKIDVAF